MISLVLVLFVLAVAYEGWIAFQTARDLRAAQRSVDAFTAAVESGDDVARATAIDDLRERAGAAHARTDGPWWGAVTLVPAIGDDARGVRALSESLDVLADDGLPAFVDALDALPSVSVGGRIDIDLLERMQPTAATAADSFAEAADLVLDEDSSGYVSLFGDDYDLYADLVDDLARGLGSAERGLEVLPTMVGADGPRDYLLVFQTNSEIRATGGLPGSWAHVHAEDGKLTMEEQGADSDFLPQRRPVVPLSEEETAVYGPEIARYFQDPGFTPDFQRAAEIFDAFWKGRSPDVPLDGVVGIDPVGMSYLLDGTGPVPVGEFTLTTTNAAEALLSLIYLEIPDPDDQDDAFELAAKNIFDAVTGDDVESPLKLVEGLRQATLEGRFQVAPFDDAVRDALEGESVLDELPTADSEADSDAPVVDVGLNDATGSKMSYYLRYGVDVSAESCDDGVQQLAGEMTMRQTITADEARALPSRVNGGGVYGTQPGKQLVFVRIYGPVGGDITSLSVGGEEIEDVEVLALDGRPVLTTPIELDGPTNLDVTWTMTTGPGQDGDGRVGVTPSVEAGTENSTFDSAC